MAGAISSGVDAEKTRSSTSRERAPSFKLCRCWGVETWGSAAIRRMPVQAMAKRLASAKAINCTTSLRLGSGMRRRWKPSCWSKRIGSAQYDSALGKTSNCQTLVSLTLARGEVPIMLALRLFLPESSTSNRARLERGGVPAEYRTARTKPGMALAEIDRVIAAGVRFGSVLADAGYGLSAPLTARKLTWAVGIPRHLKVYPTDVRMIWPVARGRPRQRHVPDILSIPAEDMLANAKWRTIS